MRRSCATLARRPAAPAPNLRLLRDEHVATARDRIFGPQGKLPGDRNFRKPLEGRTLLRWYFPSKYSLQDFRVDEYFEMQAERLAPKPPHPALGKMTKTLERVAKNRERLRGFFKSVDEATFLNSPSLQDLYGLFRLLDPDPALSFPVPRAVFREHSPLLGHAAPQAPNAARDCGSTTGAPIALAPGVDARSLYLTIKQRLGNANDLDTLLTRQQSPEEVKEKLLERAAEHSVVPDFEHVALELEHDGRGSRKALAAHLVRPDLGGCESERAKAKEQAEKKLAQEREVGHRHVREYLARRHRFVDPMYRRRRLKWIERMMAGQHKEREIKYNSYYPPHPDDTPDWPTNKGSVTVTWPSPYH